MSCAWGSPSFEVRSRGGKPRVSDRRGRPASAVHGRQRKRGFIEPLQLHLQPADLLEQLGLLGLTLLLVLGFLPLVNSLLAQSRSWRFHWLTWIGWMAWSAAMVNDGTCREKSRTLQMLSQGGG